MSRALGDMDYDDAAALRCGAKYPSSVPKPELMLLALPESEDENSPDKTALEAELVARKINSLPRRRDDRRVKRRGAPP